MANITISRGFSASTEPSPFPLSVSIETHAGWGKSWLARLGAPSEADAKFGVRRDFLARNGQRLSRAGNGELFFEINDPGVYEASAVYRSYRTFRVMFRVADDGCVTEICNDVLGNLRAAYRAEFPTEEC